MFINVTLGLISKRLAPYILYPQMPNSERDIHFSVSVRVHECPNDIG